MSHARACVLANVASFKDGWAFRTKLAETVGVCVRTVQRALTQARELGMLRTARSKPRERPPGAQGPIPCGFSHRWIIAPAQQAAAAASYLARRVARSLSPATCEQRATCDGRTRTPRTAGELAERAARARRELEAMQALWDAEPRPPPKPA